MTGSSEGRVRAAGEPVWLAPVAPVHAPRLQELASDPAVLATTLLPDPYPPDGAASFVASAIERWKRGEEHAFAVMHDALGVIGTAGVRIHPSGDGEIGYWIGHPYWNRGFGAAAARLLLAHARDDLRLRSIFARTLERNAASVRILEGLGMHCMFRGPNPFLLRWPAEEVVLEYRRDRL